MNLNGIDWVIVVAFLAMVVFCIFFFKRYTRTVSDFMVASRMAGPYMLTIAPGIFSGVSLIAIVQQNYQNGCSSSWWGMIGFPVSLMLTLFGFVTYRLRQTKAMTISQFFEERYSRKFRLFAGILCWVSGVLNYGIFPMVSARFFIGFFGLPETFQLFGCNVEIFPLVIFGLLAIGTAIACIGGQVGILFTGFFMNLIAFALFLVFMFFMLYLFDWDTIVAGSRVVADPETQNLMNPFKVSGASDFNVWFFVITMLFNAYSRGCWQGGAGLSYSAKTPHDGLMSTVLGRWRPYASLLTVLLLGLGAYAMFHLPQYASQVASINAKLATVSDPATQEQVRFALLLAKILPAGLFGLFAIMLLAGTISGDASYLHSWGTILIQDIVMSFRKKPFDPKTHMLLLRLGILGVAAFAFFFSWFFPLRDLVSMYFMITGAIYMGGAGAVVIGGLYWKRGSTPAAWTALISGTVVCGVGLACQSFWPQIGPALVRLFPDWHYLAAHLDKFPIPSQWVTFWTMFIAVASYVLVSLLGPKHVHDMDKLLHRGKYAEADTVVAKPKFTWKRLFGITPEHTPIERVLMYASFGMTMAEFLMFVVVSFILVPLFHFSDHFWEELTFWRQVPVYAVIGTISTLWIVGGGIRDAVNLVKDLRNYKANDRDDGFVE